MAYGKCAERSCTYVGQLSEDGRCPPCQFAGEGPSEEELGWSREERATYERLRRQTKAQRHD